MRKRILYYIGLLLMLPVLMNAQQDFLGFSTSNYAGINGIDLNPASIADSRFKVDILLGGFSLGLSNNYLGMRKTAFDNRVGPLLIPNSTTSFPNFSDPQFVDKYLVRREGDFTKSLYFSNRILLPSFMVTINQHNAFALTGSIRSYINLDGVGKGIADLAYLGFDNNFNWLQPIKNEQLSFQYMSWAEIGATWAHTFIDQDVHYLKAGIRPKLLFGIGSAYLYSEQLDYLVQNDSTVDILQASLQYGHSDNLNPENSRVRPYYNRPGIGLDIGVVYEWRPDYKSYKYDMDGETNLWMRDKNKYKLSVGASLTDLGSIQFDKGVFSNNITANINQWNINALDFDSIPVQMLNDTLCARFNCDPGKSTYRMNLPLAFSMQVDYNVWKDFYVNFTPFFAFQRQKNVEKVHELSRISITPRWEQKWFGVWMPLSYDQHRNFLVGTGVRVGPLIIGTNHLPSLFIKKQNSDRVIYGTDFYFALKIPILYSQVRDYDHDQVSDPRDKCIGVAGVWEFLGCPDRDGDHVQDSEDTCPDDAGLKEFNGCPDRDNDKIIDRQDACPDEPGLVEFNGCPDRDNDKIIDREDNCPDESGLAEFKGCPDRDSDGVMDKLDLCPDNKGTSENEGCPDIILTLLNRYTKASIQSVKQAKDGSFSFESLPTDSMCLFKIEGYRSESMKDARIIVANNNKKAIRSNSDSLFRFEIPKVLKNTLQTMDVQDVVVTLTQEEAEILKKAFDNLEFETGKDIIRASSFISLDELAELLKKKPNWKLKISGHTDNVGKPASNLKLSEKRAKAVKAYLMKKGVAEAQIKTEWFGQTKPVASNKTPEGRQRNRRVEMLIIE